MGTETIVYSDKMLFKGCNRDRRQSVLASLEGESMETW